MALDSEWRVTTGPAGETTMRYVSLLKFTEKGAAEIKDSRRRAEAFSQATTASGVRVIAQYWTIGEFDGVLILEAETEQAALRCLYELAADGAVKPQSMRAFDAEEFEQVLAD
jgi:uncharacterized protein with GYD domain